MKIHCIKLCVLSLYVVPLTSMNVFLVLLEWLAMWTSLYSEFSALIIVPLLLCFYRLDRFYRFFFIPHGWGSTALWLIMMLLYESQARNQLALIIGGTGRSQSEPVIGQELPKDVMTVTVDMCFLQHWKEMWIAIARSNKNTHLSLRQYCPTASVHSSACTSKTCFLQ